MTERKTRQRDAIRAVFETEARPLGPSEVLAISKNTLPSLGQATVYRAIKKLVAEGWLIPVVVAGNTRYERAELAHHHHFHCQSCDKTFDIPGCVENLSKLVPEAWKILTHELTFFGMCQSCNVEA